MLQRFHVGIDVGKRHHHACVRDTLTDQYTKVFSFTVNRNGFERFLGFLEQQGTKEQVLVGVEASGPYATTICNFLAERGYSLVEINPFQANEFRKSQGKKAKTDRIDARSLAAFLAVGSHKPLSFSNPLLENLRELTRFRADLLQDRTRQINRLRETVAEAFPELNAHLASLDSPTALALLIAYPGPQALAQANVAEVGATLSQISHGRINRAHVQVIIDCAYTTVGLLKRQQALTLKLRLLAEAILTLNTQIQQVEATIEELFSKLPYKPSDFPVGSIQSLAGILAEIDDIHRFATLKQFLSHFGWCPQTFQTGSFRLDHPRMSHAGNPYVRRMIWLLAILAVKSVRPYREYFRQRTANGKKKMHSIVAVARKILSVIYAVLKTGKPYNPEYGGHKQSSLCQGLTSL
ncbi:MAG: IS110 family transposase [Chloroflexi bacterium]|nr:IS110 family transposase [Chloroflexota bacterium]